MDQGSLQQQCVLHQRTNPCCPWSERPQGQSNALFEKSLNLARQGPIMTCVSWPVVHPCTTRAHMLEKGIGDDKCISLLHVSMGKESVVWCVRALKRCASRSSSSLRPHLVMVPHHGL